MSVIDYFLSDTSSSSSESQVIKQQIRENIRLRDNEGTIKPALWLNQMNPPCFLWWITSVCGCLSRWTRMDGREWILLKGGKWVVSVKESSNLQQWDENAAQAWTFQLQADPRGWFILLWRPVTFFNQSPAQCPTSGPFLQLHIQKTLVHISHRSNLLLSCRLIHYQASGSDGLQMWSCKH